MRKVLTFIMIACILGISGCACGDSESEKEEEVSTEVDQFANRMKIYDNVSNIRVVNQHFILYDISNGTVTCYEHKSIQQMACWKNGKDPVVRVQERTNF